MEILKKLFGNKQGEVKDLIKKALHHKDWRVRLDAAAQLQVLKSAESVEYLMVALKDNDSAVRNLAARSLGGIGDPRAVEALRAALKDGDDELRNFAGEALADMGDSSAGRPSIRVLRKNSDVQGLIQALNHSAWQVRSGAAGALGDLKAAESVEYLIVALKDNHSAVRHLAAISLGWIGDPRAVEALRAALKDGDDELLRAYAREALAKFGIIVSSGSTSIGEKKIEIKCSVCNRTNVEYLRDLKRKDPNVYIISQKFIGTCPKCNKAYCVEHAAYDGTIDHEVCPIHKEKLVVE
jgi:HEAT repeat protein